MQRTLDYFAVYFAGGKRAVLVAAYCFDGVVLAVCAKEGNLGAVDVELFAAVFLYLAFLGYLDKCQL